jgi:hypothetical protein
MVVGFEQAQAMFEGQLFGNGGLSGARRTANPIDVSHKNIIACRPSGLKRCALIFLGVKLFKRLQMK